MRLLVTRPQPDGERTAAVLRGRGHEVILAPLLRIEGDDNLDLGPGPYAGVAITSANAARVLASHPRRAELAALPLYAVGRRSAEAARAAGFITVVSADKDVHALAHMIEQRHAGSSQKLLYLAAEHRAGDLGSALESQGIKVRTVALYRAVKATMLPAPVQTALRSGTIEGVLHFSRRTAETYLACARAAGLERDALAPTQYCISAKTGEPLTAAGAARTLIAAHPDEEMLLALIASPTNNG